MQNYYFFPENLQSGTKAMVFVDGENLAIRYEKILGDNSPQPHVDYEPDIFVWTRFANTPYHHSCEVIRRHYYTSAIGDSHRIDAIMDKLKEIGIEAPRVFKKAKGKRTKRVDITLATEMLSHAHRKNYDLAVLVAGDEDYVPLVEAVMSEGRRVVLWFFEPGLSPHLRRAVDHCFNIGSWFLAETHEVERRFQ